MSAEVGDIDVREGLSSITDAIVAVHRGAVYELYDSDLSDADVAEDDRGPVVIMISRERLDELLEYEFRYESVSK